MEIVESLNRRSGDESDFFGLVSRQRDQYPHDCYSRRDAVRL